MKLMMVQVPPHLSIAQGFRLLEAITVCSNKLNILPVASIINECSLTTVNHVSDKIYFYVLKLTTLINDVYAKSGQMEGIMETNCVSLCMFHSQDYHTNFG